MRRRAPGFVAALVAFAAVAAVAPPASAYFEQTEVGARGVALGRTFVAIADDASAIYWNPAGLTALRTPQLHTTHHRPFLVPDLSLNFLGGAWPLRHGTVHAAWSHLGLSGAMSEDLFYAGGSHAWEVLDARRVSVGGSLKLARISWNGAVATGSGVPLDLGSESKVAADLAVHVRWSPRLTAGWIVRNLGEPEWDFVPGGGGTKVEVGQEIGFAYQWHPESKVTAAFVESSDGELTPVLGAEILFYDVFALRAGVGDLKFFGGVGVRAGRLLVDTSFSTHNTLGISTMASVNIALGSAE
ncbi:hypothetical protein K8I85_13750 [bacterium]|nr:hypothetical protein [bacterium]